MHNSIAPVSIRRTVTTMSDSVYGYTNSGAPINDEMIEQFADEAETGYDAGQLSGRRRGRGRDLAAEIAETRQAKQWQ
jgi:hypothetical protein